MKEIVIAYDFTPEMAVDEIETLLKNFGITYNIVESDGTVIIEYEDQN